MLKLRARAQIIVCASRRSSAHHSGVCLVPVSSFPGLPCDSGRCTCCGVYDAILSYGEVACCGLSAPIATTDLCQLVYMSADRVLFQCSSCCPSCCPCPMPALNTITTVPAQHSQTTETVTATRSPLHASQLHASKLHICAHLRCTYSTSARSPSPLASV